MQKTSILNKITIAFLADKYKIGNRKKRTMSNKKFYEENLSFCEEIDKIKHFGTGSPDFMILCSDNDGKEKAKGCHFHKSYLSKLSDAFKAMVNNSSYTECQKSGLTIEPDEFIKSSTIKDFHKFLYDDHYNFEHFTIGLMVFTEKYNIRMLYSYCSAEIGKYLLDNDNARIIIENNYMINDDHVLHILKAANMLNDKILFGAAVKFIYRHFENIQKTVQWENLITQQPEDLTTKAFHQFFYEDQYEFSDFTVGLLVDVEKNKSNMKILYSYCSTEMTRYLLDNKNEKVILENDYMVNEEDHVLDFFKAANMINDKNLFVAAFKFINKHFKKIQKTKKWKHWANIYPECMIEIINYQKSQKKNL